MDSLLEQQQHETQQANWSPRERAAWKSSKGYAVGEWSDMFRILDEKSSAEPGRWRTSRTPYLREIMDAFCDPHVEQITLMCSTQIGKTETINNMICYAIDQDPGPAMFVIDTKENMREMSEARLQPMILKSEKVAQHILPGQDSLKKLQYNFDHMVMYLAGAHSPGTLGSKPVRYLFLDEIDKYPRFSGAEANPISLAIERTRTFYDRKIVAASTPTTAEGYIHRRYQVSDRCRYYVPCPHCGEYQVFVFAQLKWPEGERDPERIRAGSLAWYECAKCAGKIEDRHKPMMLDRGVWCPEACTVDKSGTVVGDRQPLTHRGYWLNCFYSPWLKFCDIAAKFLESRGRADEMMNFTNSWLAELWDDKVEPMEPDHIKARCLDYDKEVIPAGCLVLTAAVDVQKHVFKLVIRGWGLNEESWLILAGEYDSKEVVEEILFGKIYSGARDLKVRLTAMDSGYETSSVYEFCRKWAGQCIPIKGREMQSETHRVTMLDKYPDGKPMKGGLRLHTLDVNYYKDKLHRFLHSQPGDPGDWHIYRGVFDRYCHELSGESRCNVRDKRNGRLKQVWRKKSGATRNDYWDLEVYNTAVADILNLPILLDPRRGAHQQGQSTQRPRQASGNSWIQNDKWNDSAKGWVDR